MHTIGGRIPLNHHVADNPAEKHISHIVVACYLLWLSGLVSRWPHISSDCYTRTRRSWATLMLPRGCLASNLALNYVIGWQRRHALEGKGGGDSGRGTCMGKGGGGILERPASITSPKLSN